MKIPQEEDRDSVKDDWTNLDKGFSSLRNPTLPPIALMSNLLDNSTYERLTHLFGLQWRAA
ncbi:MAG: hypothetical protein CMO12_02905 [Thaumarchaeota archaeon]|nr:hypothetical protein [Nitrososphaerota archaeon]